jgi:hypothetical protein
MIVPKREKGEKSGENTVFDIYVKQWEKQQGCLTTL